MHAGRRARRKREISFLTNQKKMIIIIIIIVWFDENSTESMTIFIYFVQEVRHCKRGRKTIFLEEKVMKEKRVCTSQE